jgi:hypothetical protein
MTKTEYLSRAVEYIALNDDAEELRISVVKNYQTVVLVSEVFKVSASHVARAVVAIRKGSNP